MIAEALALTMVANQPGRLCVANAADQPFWINVWGVAIGGDLGVNLEFKHLKVGAKYCARLPNEFRYEVRLMPGDDMDAGTPFSPPDWAGEFCFESTSSEQVSIRVLKSKPGALAADGKPADFECAVTTSKAEG